MQRPYTTDGLNRYSAAGTASFTYDANGNLATTPGPAQNEVLTYTYDVENRLVGRTSTGASPAVTLAYDPLGRLWRVQGAAGTTRFLYDGDALAIETDGAGSVLRAFAHGPGSDEPLVWYEVPGGWRRLYPRADHQGSIVAAGGDNGALALINRYDEYGIPAGTNTGRFQYTGQIWIPELGMYYYKARVYSPTLGRFLQTDPIGYEGGINLYAYVGNEPINLVDTLGLAPGDPYLTPRDASVDFQNSYNPRSINENREYNAATYELRDRYYSTEGVRTGTSGGTARFELPPGARVVEKSHTHGDYTRRDRYDNPVRTSRTQDQYQSDEVNSEDRGRANREGMIVTVGTPSGNYLRYDPATGRVETVTPYIPIIVRPELPTSQEERRRDTPDPQ